MTSPIDSTSSVRPRLLLIDGHSVAYRAFYALPVDNFATSSGQHTNAVYGFTSMLINVLRDEQPTHVAVAFDMSRHTFRTEEFPEYKANRATSPEEFSGQVPLIQEVLNALQIVHLELPDYEADDIIATLSHQASQAGWETLICTGDRDSIQLINDNTTVLYPLKGVSDLLRLTPTTVEERYLVPPQRYPELAALVGETSDNLPGVPGVGPKTAAKWLAEYGDLETLLAHADTLRTKAGRNLAERVELVQRNRRLNALVRDLDLTVALTDLERRDWDREAVHTVFDALEFRTLRERLMDTFPTGEAEPDAGFELDTTMLGPGEVSAWLDQHGSGTVGVQVEGHWRAGHGDATGMALASADGAAAWLDLPALTPADDAALASWLADEAALKVMHDAKGPLHALTDRGWAVAGLRCDTQLAAYLLRPDQRSYDLADLSMRHLQRELVIDSDSQVGEGQLALDFGDGEAATAAMVRARAVAELGEALIEELAAHNGVALLDDLEMPIQRCLVRMERAGIAVDIDQLDSLHAEFDAEVKQAEADAYQSIGKQINLNSPKQLQGVLFDELNMPKTRRTRTGYTTDADALEKLYAQTEHPFLAHLLRHRDQIKLRQTVEGLHKAVADDGRIHTTYLQTAAATGRLSSTDPNLQNIPIRTEAGRRIREVFVRGVGYEALMSVDYSQIEMRIMAHASGDESLIEAFVSGVDFHSATAASVFGVPVDQVTPDQRAKIKAMNYGLAYGLGAFGLSGQLRISTGEARALMDEYFERFGKVRDYLTGIVDEARKTGYTETILGRRRYLPDLNSTNRQRREMAERMALNAPIQGSAADIMKVAMLDVEAALADQGLSSRTLLQVHDELVMEVAPGEEEVLTALVRDRLGHAIELTVPLDVSVGVGPNWHDAAH